MRNISSAFRRALANDKRDYQNRVRFTLADNTVFDVRNDQLWDDGLHIDDAVSNDNSFQIGAAIINQCKIVLNNIYHDFSEYNFDGAKIVVYTGLNDLDDGSDEEIKLGTYEVDETSYDGSLITLTCLDNMSKFDNAYETNLQFPATLYQIVADACNICGVDLDTSSLNFPHKDYIVSTKPSRDNTTFRQVISWTAQIACCFARCNVDGNLEIRWYNTDEFDNFTTGIDGGVFDGKSVQWLSSYMNTETGMTVVSNTRVDDDWFRINNSIGYEFNGSAMSYLYIASNSRFKFSDSTTKPGSSTSTNHDVNICGRDGQSISVKYQTISDSSRNALKVRFHGYTRYNQAYQTREYELEYEIFFTDLGAIVINFITLPTASGYLGTTSIIENNVSSPFTPTTENIVALYRGSGNTWTTEPVATGEYVSGDTADGGTFSPWNTGDEYDGGNFDDFADMHFIQSSYSSHISTDNVVITGVKVIKKIKVDGASDIFEEYSSGTSGYVIVIENNDLIEGVHGQDVADWVGTIVNGVQFRKASITHPSDPSIEAGDVAIYFDENGNSYPILVSSTTFTPGNSQITTSSAETPKKNSSQRFSQATRDYVEIRQRLSKQKTEWEEAAEDLSDRIDNASGLYCTEVVEQGATKTYYHNKPVLEESDILMLFSSVGFTLSADGGTTWYGMTVDGQMIASILNTVGVNADWINTGHLSFMFCRGGTLSLGGANNGNGVLEIFDSSGNRVGRWDNTGLYLGNVASDLTAPNTSIGTGGAISTKSLTASDYVYVDGNSNSYLNIPMGSTGSYTRVTSNGFYVKDVWGTDIFISNSNTNERGLRIRPSNASPTSSQEGTDLTGTSLYIMKVGGAATVSISSETIALSRVADGFPTFLAYTNGYNQYSGKGVMVRNADFTVTGGTKNRVVETEDYSMRTLTCYEMPSPMFGDIGEGVVGDDGLCYVSLDPIFLETISDGTYQVFLQKYGMGECYVSERKSTYFVVKGEPNLSFAWEIKAKQIDFDQQRLPILREPDLKEPWEEDIDYGTRAMLHIRSIMEERSLDNA